MTKNQKTSDVLRVQGVMEKGYGIIPKLVMQDRRLSIEAKAIYSYFRSFAGAGTTAFPGRDKILYDLQISINRYYNHFDLLKEYGYIKVERIIDPKGRFKNNVYTMIEYPCIQNEDMDDPCLHGPNMVEPYMVGRDTNNNNTKINRLNINRKQQQPKTENVVVVPVQADDISENAKKEPDVSNTSDPIYKLILDNLNISLTQKQVAMFDKLCNGNIDKFVEKVNMLKKQSEIREPMGWLIRALQEDYKESIPYINSESDTKKKKSSNKFINYEQREWDYETIERLAMEVT